LAPSFPPSEGLLLLLVPTSNLTTQSECAKNSVRYPLAKRFLRLSQPRPFDAAAGDLVLLNFLASGFTQGFGLQF
jgi:hypothetical protein